MNFAGHHTVFCKDAVSLLFVFRSVHRLHLFLQFSQVLLIIGRYKLEASNYFVFDETFGMVIHFDCLFWSYFAFPTVILIIIIVVLYYSPDPRLELSFLSPASFFGNSVLCIRFLVGVFNGSL